LVRSHFFRIAQMHKVRSRAVNASCEHARRRTRRTPHVIMIGMTESSAVFGAR
jgi:hypothetical protein